MGAVLCLSLGRRKKPHYEGMVQAAEAMARCMEAVKAERLRRGLPLDEEDRLATGLVGTGYTAITTTLGSPEGKRTSCQPDMAALIYDLYVQAGVRPGDRVGLCCSGSFPALNLAAVCAAEALGATPVTIVSVGASTYGANLPEFTAPEMLYHLYDQGLIATKPAAVTLCGGNDAGGEMGWTYFPEDAAPYEAMLARLKDGGIELTLWADRAQNLAWRESVYGDVACFVSVGGHVMAMGQHDEGYALGQGLVTQPVTDGGDYLLGRYLSRGTPCLVLLNVKALAEAYGLPFDPPALEKIGTNGVYYEKGRLTWPVGLALLLMGGLLLACLKPAPRRNTTMHPERMNQFLTRYERAETRRDKALAVYDALIAAVPADQLPAFLGEGGDAFLTFVHTLQNEDADIGTAVAREDEAPDEEYLSALAEKLKAL